MAHLQYMPGDPRLVDQLVYELKSKGIFDQFRKECIADVDTRPAYQNLRQRVENSVAAFLSRQVWKPDLNKNQLREKLRKHILDGNYLEQGVERIVDQVVNPKVASVFIPQVEDLVYNYLGIARKKPTPETSNGKVNDNDLLPTDLEAVSPGSVKSNDDKVQPMDEVKDDSMDIDQLNKTDNIENKEESCTTFELVEREKTEQDTVLSGISELSVELEVSIDKSTIPLPEELRAEDIPPPENSPPKLEIHNKLELPLKIDVDKIELPKGPNLSLNFSTNPVDIPLPEEGPKQNRDSYFKPIDLNSDDDSSSDSSLRRNMSPLTPIRNFNNENSCDAQQGFENDSDSKSDDKKQPSSFRFALETKSPENNIEKSDKKDTEQTALSYQFDNQVNINSFATPMYEDSSNSHNLQIDYESDVNSKMIEVKPEAENSEDSKKDKKVEEKRSSHKSSQRSRDSHRHSHSSKDKRSDSKHSNSRDSSRHDKKSAKDDKSKSSKERERSKDRNDKKDSRDSSKHRSSHKSSSHKDSKSHKSSSSSRHSSKTDNKNDKGDRNDKSSDRNDKSSDRSKEKKDSKSSSSKSEKDKRSSTSSSKNEKDKKKDKKENDDHYSVSGRGNHTRRSTDRDSNDGSSSSKGSRNRTGSKNSGSTKENKSSSAKSDNTSTASDTTSPSDKDVIVNTENESKTPQSKPVVRVEKHLEVPISSPPRLPFVPDVTLKKPKFAANLQEAKKLMKMRKFLDEEQKRMNQEAALLLEFQANVRPSLSQVYSNISGPELEFACINNSVPSENQVTYEIPVTSTNSVETLVQASDAVDTTITYEIPVCHDNNIDNEVQSNIIEPMETPSITVEEVKEEDTNNLEHSCVEEDTIVTEENSANNNIEHADIESKITDNKLNNTETYNENKPFSQLVDEITEYSKASEKLRNEKTTKVETDEFKKPLTEEENKNLTKLFEVTVITEELSESEDFDKEKTEIILPDDIKDLNEIPLEYFAEHEKYDAEISCNQYDAFLKNYLEKTTTTDKLYLINCDSYEENIIKDAAKSFGHYEIVNYYKNGHLKVPKTTKNLVKDVNLNEEISLPLDNKEYESNLVFSPVKSECSFELSSDYTAKLEEMVNKTSRQQVMEIILGSVIDESPCEMPKIDYCMDVCIDDDNSLKRKIEVESSENNNTCVLTPTKLRKLSDSDQISSTTEETEENSNNNSIPNNTRSKYLSKARRVGLPRPRKTNLPNSPSSDKSVENYEQNTPTPPQTPNGKVRTPQRKVQRYDTSDLYKPKLHYLSRRNNIT